MARGIVRNGRLLEPGEPEGLQGARGPDRLVDPPLHVGVDHEREVGAEMRAHRRDPLYVLGELRPPDLHLDGAKALGEVALSLAQQGVGREVEIDAAGIAGDARVVAAEEIPKGQAGAPGLQIPDRYVE